MLAYLYDSEGNKYIVPAKYCILVEVAGLELADQPEEEHFPVDFDIMELDILRDRVRSEKLGGPQDGLSLIHI